MIAMARPTRTGSTAYDDDADGEIDEDFGAISKQMFSCQYYDDLPVSTQRFPQHNPLHLNVRQESYQWEEDRYDDFVGVEYHITNIGQDVLTDVYVGFFADCDAGNRDTENYFNDDGTGFKSVPVRCLDLGPVSMDIAYTYDVDGDEGRTPGYLGVLFLGHTTDPNNEFAPRRVGVATYQNFAGNQSFEDSGDPTNDFERYQLLSSRNIERDATIPRDYRMLMAAGPFAELLPGSTLVFQTAFAIGAGIDGLIANAGSAQFTFEGAWFNLDGDRNTGVRRPGDACRRSREWNSDRQLSESGASADQRPARNHGVDQQRLRRRAHVSDRVRVPEADSAKFRTGIAGNETQVFWMIGTAPPPPSMRVDANDASGVSIYWDNYSESQPDVKTQEFDFEGYRGFAPDNWHRPFGTSAANGPGASLWKMLFRGGSSERPRQRSRHGSSTVTIRCLTCHDSFATTSSNRWKHRSSSSRPTSRRVRRE
jgi:hypothetical protein